MKVGTGLVVARAGSGLESWSAPCAIGTGGVGFGLQVITASSVVMSRYLLIECFLFIYLFIPWDHVLVGFVGFIHQLSNLSLRKKFAQVGAELTDIVLILNCEAVDAFASGSQVSSQLFGKIAADTHAPPFAFPSNASHVLTL